ncbi:MAG: AEC family transporter, partial [Desulfatiglandales bacterium]
MGLKETFFQILPVFLLMGLGGLARQLGYLTRESIPVLNMLTYYMAIPVMIFLEISKYDLRTDFHITPVFLTCFAVLPTALFAYILGKISYSRGPTLGSFVQSSIHGNLGYLGLAVSYYVTGSQ